MKYFKNFDTFKLSENNNTTDNNNDIINLFGYLNLSDKEKCIDLSLKKSDLLDSFIEENYAYNFSKSETKIIESDLSDLDKVKSLSNDFKIAFGEWILENVQYLKLQSIMPSWYYLTNPTILENQWVIHLTDNPYSIMKKGFVHSNDDINTLGLTKYINKESKKEGGINFGYTIEDFHKYGYDAYNKGYGKHNLKYGSGIVIFKTSGIRVYHKTDEEYQILFYGKNITDTLVIDYNDVNKKWFIQNINDEKLVEKDTIDDITEWLKLNYK